MAVNYHEGETDPSGFRDWWNSSSLQEIFVPPYRQCLSGSDDSDSDDDDNDDDDFSNIITTVFFSQLF